MASLSTMAQNGKAVTEKKTFSRTTTITDIITADDSTIWSLLTNAVGYPNWSYTVISIEGEIEVGQKIKLKSTLAPDRTFKLKVKEMVPNHRLVWGDGMGERTYTLEQVGEGTRFTMTEKIGGLMFPLFAGKIPAFDASFEQFLGDLKMEAD